MMRSPATSPSSKRRWQLAVLLLGTLAIVVFRLLWGHAYCAEGLPFYSIDENDIVEPAAGFLMGDLNHQFYTYGPLFMYLLSLVYAAAALLTGHSVHLFATDVFLDAYWHYYLARLLGLIVILATLVIAVVETERTFSFLAAVLCLVLLAFPVAENFTEYTVRIDVLQGLFQLLALFSIVRFFASGGLRHYVMAGAWIGLAVASKPIPGALIVPIAVGVALARTWKERRPAERGQALVRSWRVLIRSFASDRRLYLATAAGIGTFSIGFPFAILDFKNFWLQQATRIRADATEAFPRGWDSVQYLPYAGWFLCVLGVLALLYQFWRGSAAARIIAAFVVLYLLVFFPVPARNYFFVPILAPTIICISLMLTDLLRSIPQLTVRVALILVLGLVILFTLPPSWGHPRQREQLNIHQWVIEHVPQGTKLCSAGWHTNGPRLVSSQDQTAAENEYFMFGRDKNPHYVAGYREAYRRYVLSGRPVYEIANWGRRQLSAPDQQAQLLEFCAQHGSRYLILAGVPPFPSLPGPVISGGGISVFELEQSRT